MNRASAKRLIGFLVTGWVVIALDQFTKYLAIANLTPGKPYLVFGDFLRFILVYNNSAAFSIGFGMTWIFSIISTLAALAILWFGPKLQTMGWAITGGIALGGVVGNLIDRLTRAPGFGTGQVVDFISIPFNFPIFNVADMSIVAVAIITVVRVMRGTKVGQPPMTNSTSHNE